MATLSQDDILNALDTMTVLQLNDLVKALEEKFGVSAAAPVMMAGGPAAPVAEEKDTFEAVLVTAGAPAFAENEALSPLPTLRPVPAGTVHQVRLDVKCRRVEIAPGVWMTAWAYGDSVPGPTLHVRQGDRVVFTMTNRSNESA